VIKKLIILIIVFSAIVNADIRINEFLPDPIGLDADDMPEGEWIELYNEGSKDIDLEGYNFYDNAGSNPDIVIANTNTYSTIIKAKDYLVVYMNGRSQFLNNDGFEKINLTDLNDSLVDEISYSNSKEGISWGLVEGVWQYGLPTPNEENKGNKSIENSNIKIKKIYGTEIKWGDIIRVKFDVFKADTRKNSIKAWIEKDNKKVSEITSMNIYGKYSDYNLILPIKIKDNCDDKFEDGKYNVIVEGLDDDDSEEIKIENNNCIEIKEKKEVVIKEKEVKEEPKSEKVIYARNEIIYESSQDKIKRAGIFFMSGIIILLLLYYVWEK